MDGGSVHERNGNLRPESLESPSLDEKSVKEIFSKHYARKSRDRYPKFSNKPKRLVLKKKPLVLPKVLRGELSQSSASYQFVEGESVSALKRTLTKIPLRDCSSSQKTRHGKEGLKIAAARGPMQKSGAQSLVPMLNTTVGEPWGFDNIVEFRKNLRKSEVLTRILA